MTDLETQVKRALELSEKAIDKPELVGDDAYRGGLTNRGKFYVHCNPAFVKALCEDWLGKKNEKTKIEIASMRDTVRNKLLADERDTLRAQVKKMRAALKQVTDMAAWYVSGSEGRYYEITEARKVLREIDEAMK